MVILALAIASAVIAALGMAFYYKHYWRSAPAEEGARSEDQSKTAEVTHKAALTPAPADREDRSDSNKAAAASETAELTDDARELDVVQVSDESEAVTLDFSSPQEQTCGKGMADILCCGGDQPAPNTSTPPTEVQAGATDN